MRLVPDKRVPVLPVLGSTDTSTVVLNDPAETFAQFWAAYPKRRAKIEAWYAWSALRPDAALVARILAALAWQTTQPDWTRDGGRFIPYPAAWLRAGRWDDEPVQVAVPQPKTTGMYKSWVPLKDRQ